MAIELPARMWSISLPAANRSAQCQNSNWSDCSDDVRWYAPMLVIWTVCSAYGNRGPDWTCCSRGCNERRSIPNNSTWLESTFSYLWGQWSWSLTQDLLINEPPQIDLRPRLVYARTATNQGNWFTVAVEPLTMRALARMPSMWPSWPYVELSHLKGMRSITGFDCKMIILDEKARWTELWTRTTHLCWGMKHNG